MPNAIITPPRVPLIDPRTGLIDRAWFLFFLSLNNAANDVNNNPDVGPSVGSLLATYDAALQSLAQVVGVQPASDSAELTAQLADVRQELQVLPRAELGTMAQLQQANLPWLTFDTTPESVPTATPGTLYWDSADGNQTLSLVMGNGVTTQQIGEEQYFRIKADAAITEGQVVMFTGTVGASGALKGAPATGLTASTALYVMGVATETMAVNQWGYVTSFGLVRGINTTGGAEAWVDGQILYLDPTVAGGLTKTVPIAPNPKVVVAAVVHAATNGSLFIRPAFGGKLGDFEGDVNIVSPVAGNLLQYSGTVWQNVTPSSVINAVSGSPATKTADFTVADTENWLINNKTSTCTVTLPAASAYTGRVLNFTNYQPQLLVSASSDVVLITGGSTQTSILPATDGAWATLVSNGANWRILQAG